MELPTILGADSDPKPKRKQGKGLEIKELLTLLVLNQEGPVGRYHLKKLIGLSEHEGLVKQMLADLQKQNYVSANKSGSTLTEKGKALLKERLKALHIADIKPFESPISRAEPASIGLHLQNRGHKIDSAMKIRDIAVRGGAIGATIILFKEGKLSIPSVSPDFLSENPSVAKRIHESFNLKENDVVAIVSADDEQKGFEASIIIAEALL